MKKETQRIQGARVIMSWAVCWSWTERVKIFHTHMCQRNSMFLFPPLIWEHYMGINILLFCVPLPHLVCFFIYSLQTTNKISECNALVKVRRSRNRLGSFLFAKGFLCLISPWDSSAVYTFYQSWVIWLQKGNSHHCFSQIHLLDLFYIWIFVFSIILFKTDLQDGCYYQM